MRRQRTCSKLIRQQRKVELSRNTLQGNLCLHLSVFLCPRLSEAVPTRPGNTPFRHELIEVRVVRSHAHTDEGRVLTALSLCSTATFLVHSKAPSIVCSSCVRVPPARRMLSAVSLWHAKMMWSYIEVSPDAVVSSTTWCLLAFTETMRVARCSCEAGSFDSMRFT